MKKRNDLIVSALDVPRIGFECLSLFDWITPLLKIGQAIKHDPPLALNSWTFFVPNTKAIHKGWSQRHIKQLLEANGISVYGDMVSFGELSFKVPISQAGKAEDILNQYQIPIKPRSQGAPRPQESPKPQRSLFNAGSRSVPESSRCEYCKSFDIRKGKCHNCGAMTK